MQKRLRHTATALALSFGFLCLWPGVTAASAAPSFKDTGSHWSKPVVEKAYALDLMKGYPGNVFKPEDPVTRLEAIAIIIRAMGLEEEAKNLDYKKSGVNLPSGMFWGQGHLVLAVKKGLGIDKDYVQNLQFGSPITRKEVATLVALALKDKLKVRGDVTKLGYSDSDKIDQVYKPYVADVTQNNIMQGIESNQFGPEQEMKRGQMAALVVKTAQDGWFSYGADNIASGTLVVAESGTGIVSIKKADGTSIFRLVDSGTLIYKDGKEATLGDFKIGDAVTAISATGKLKYLESTAAATTPAASTPAATSTPATTPAAGDTAAEIEITGKVMARSLTGSPFIKIRDSGCREQAYTLASVVIVTDGTNSRDLANVNEGTYITVKVRDNAIQNIRLLSTTETEGEVTNIIPGYLTVKNSSGEIKLFSVKAGDIKISKGSDLLAYTELQNGNRVRLVSASGEVQEITVITTAATAAAANLTEYVTLRTVDTDYRRITVLDSNGSRKDLEVELQARIKKINQTLRLADLLPDDNLRIKYGVNGKVNEIFVVGAEDRLISGTVTELFLGTDPYIKIDSVKYNINQNLVVMRNGEYIYVGNIMNGSRVDMEWAVNSYVKNIDITDDQNITADGSVTEVDEGGNKIKFQQSSHQSFTLTVSGSCTFRDQTASPADLKVLGDIKKGWTIQINLSNGVVTNIKVLGK